MRTSRAALLALATAAAGAALAQTGEASAARGALLYENHCGACQSEKMHWRAQRRARDWDTLRDQVRQWQAAAHLEWTPEDIEAVTRHLNDSIYHYPLPGQRAGRD